MPAGVAFRSPPPSRMFPCRNNSRHKFPIFSAPSASPREKMSFYLLSHLNMVLCPCGRRPCARLFDILRGKKGKVRGRPGNGPPRLAYRRAGLPNWPLSSGMELLHFGGNPHRNEPKYRAKSRLIAAGNTLRFFSKKPQTALRFFARKCKNEVILQISCCVAVVFCRK